MDVTELKERLGEAGLQPMEADVFVHLLSHGPAGAGQVATGLGRARSEVYRVLERMAGAGLVVASLARPTTYSATPPERMFRLLLLQQQEALERVRRVGEQMMPVMAALGRGAAPGATDASVRIVQGRERILQNLGHAATRSARTLDLYLNAPDASAGWSRQGLWQLVEDRARNGTGARALLHPKAEAPAGALPAWVRRAAAAPSGEFVLVDGREAHVWVRVEGRQTAKGRAQESVLVTDAPGLVGLLSDVFKAAWAATQA